MKKANACVKCGETRYPLTKSLCPKCQKREYRSHPCAHPGCHRKRSRRGLCGVHIAEGIANGTIVIEDQSPKTCSEPDCDRKVKGHGLCSMHYKRMRNRLNPNFDPTKSLVEREKLGIDYKTEKIANSAAKKQAQIIRIDSTSRTNEFVEFKITAEILASRAGVEKKMLSTLLGNLKEDGHIKDFNFDKKTQVITLQISPGYETLFHAGINAKPDDVEEL